MGHPHFRCGKNERVRGEGWDARPVGSWLRRALVEAEGYFYVDHGGYGLVVFFAGFEAPGFYGFDGFFVQA
jgi:hypothetical protein